jgi:hypothetical protein
MKKESFMKKTNLRDQKGVALILSILMLLVLTFLGMSSIGSTVFETQISGNERWGSAAFYAGNGGVDVGISRLPNISAYSGNINSDQSYRSGKMTPKSPQPLKNFGVMIRPGYDTTWEFRRFQVNATGESFGAMKEIEVQVSMGPYSAGTVYNN